VKVEELTGFSQLFAPQEPVALEADDVVDEVASLVELELSPLPPPDEGGVRSMMRLGTAISSTLSIIPTARGIRGPSLTIFAASRCSMMTILEEVIHTPWARGGCELGQATVDKPRIEFAAVMLCCGLAGRCDRCRRVCDRRN
jgi:hypothetical protein